MVRLVLMGSTNEWAKTGKAKVFVKGFVVLFEQDIFHNFANNGVIMDRMNGNNLFWSEDSGGSGGGGGG